MEKVALPDLERAAEAAYGMLLAHWPGRLPVDPLPMLRGPAGAVVMSWDRAARLLQERGLDPDQVLTMTGSIAALQFTLEDSRLVLLMPDQIPAARRFTLAHELGHIVLGHEGESSAADREANHFAAHLLLPRPLLALQELDAPGALLRCARLFGVTVSLLRTVLDDRTRLAGEMYLAAKQRLPEMYGKREG